MSIQRHFHYSVMKKKKNDCVLLFVLEIIEKSSVFQYNGSQFIRQP